MQCSKLEMRPGTVPVLREYPLATVHLTLKFRARFMRQFVTIATNTFMELVRQPIFLLLTTASAVFLVFLASVPYFGFGDEPILVKQSVLAVMLLAGLSARC